MLEIEEESPQLSVVSPRLPYLVLELLLDYLGISTLKTLRLVCKTTKCAVETAQHLRHFQVRITGKNRLDDLLRTPEPVPWNNFIFFEKRDCLSSADIQRFVLAYGDQVLHLELDWRWGEKVQQAHKHTLILLSGCPHLESLQSYLLSFQHVMPNHEDLTQRLLENWKKLRQFSVYRIHGHPSRPFEEMRFFSQVLSSCAKLETLAVPNFGLLHQSTIRGGYADSFQEFVVTPLLDALEQGRLHSVTVPHDRVKGELLLRLAHACRKSGTVLHNVGCTFLANLSPEHFPVLDIIGDLCGVTDAIISQSLTSVRSIRLSQYFHLENDEYTMPPFPHLNDLDFDFQFLNRVEDRKRLELFVHRLAQVRRPTLKVVSVGYASAPTLADSVNISPVDLGTSFVNLRELHVKNWAGEDEEWLQLWALVAGTLVELVVWDCPNLSDQGILGEDLNQPALLQLKNLRELTLSKKEVGSGNAKITELSFVHAFRHMRLRSFVFFEGAGHTSHRRFSEEMVEAMWSGPFGETIEEFLVQSTDLVAHRSGGKQKSLMIRREGEMSQNVCDSKTSIFIQEREPSQENRRRKWNASCSIT